jgi:putative nucleotidyltransferase with HDIG domain
MATNLVDSASPAASEAGLRQVRLLEIVAKGLPPFPHTVLELTAILSGPSADVKKAAKLIRTDAALSAQLLRMCSSPMFGLRSRVVSIGQAATLLGADRLRTLVMTTSMVDMAGSGLPREESTRFWQHSFLAALLSEHLAKHTGYSESEQAYIAGLLHDIGQVPHWMLVCEERARKKVPPPENWFDNPPVERAHFGLDHCHLGGLMATGWNFMPSFIDVISNHHQPDQAEHDPYLAKIVGTVEHFLLTRVSPEGENDAPKNTNTGTEAVPANGAQVSELASGSAEERTSQSCDDSEWQGIAEDLDAEYNRLLPVVAGGLTNVLSGAS